MKTPDSWKTVSLFEICKPKQWPTIPQSKFLDHGYPVFGANGRIGFYSEYNHEESTILITCRGATCGTINLCDPKSYVTGNAMALDDLDDSEVDMQFLIYLLKYRGVRKAITGTAQPQITRQSLKSIRVSYPALEEQKRLAGILGEAESLSEMRTQCIKNASELAESLFEDMFGHPKANRYNFPTEFLAKICSPKQWPTISSKDLTDVGYPVYGANGLIGKYKTYTHEHSTILITCRGATCGTINVCQPKSYVTGNAMALDAPDTSQVNLAYLEYALRCRGLSDAISGSAQPQITRQNLQHVRLPIPPMSLQEQFSDRLEAANGLKELQRTALASHEELSQTLQALAFSGEL